MGVFFNMQIFDLLLVGIGVAMDAFAVAVSKGLTMQEKRIKNAVIVATYFGVFQAIMPMLGFISGIGLGNIINKFSGSITFILLTLVGINMIKETSEEQESQSNNLSFKTMFLLALATSIDAYAVGITFVFIETDVLLATFLMGIITFVLSFIGVNLGNIFSGKFEKHAKILGGLILIIIAFKSLLQI